MSSEEKMGGYSDKKKFLSEHYGYEIEMMRWAYRRLEAEEYTGRFEPNALIEVFCLHARILLDFYGRAKQDKNEKPKPPNSDDALAEHFVRANGAASDAASDIAEIVKKIDVKLIQKINKQIAHLTKAREKAEKINSCDRLNLFLALEEAHQLFKRSVKPEYAGCFSYKVNKKFEATRSAANTTSSIIVHKASSPGD